MKLRKYIIGLLALILLVTLPTEARAEDLHQVALYKGIIKGYEDEKYERSYIKGVEFYLFKISDKAISKEEKESYRDKYDGKTISEIEKDLGAPIKPEKTDENGFTEVYLEEGAYLLAEECKDKADQFEREGRTYRSFPLAFNVGQDFYEDEGAYIKVVTKPLEIPKKPDEPDKPDKPEKPTDNAYTGDRGIMLPFLSVIVLSAGLVIIGKKKEA